MQDAYVPALGLQLADKRDHTAKSAGSAVFDGPDSVGVVQMYERDAGNTRWLLRWLSGFSTACDDAKCAYR